MSKEEILAKLKQLKELQQKISMLKLQLKEAEVDFEEELETDNIDENLKNI